MASLVVDRAQLEATLLEIDASEQRFRSGVKPQLSIDRALHGDFGDCTTTAAYVVERHGGRLCGCGGDGHDFAVVGPFVIDWWASSYEAIMPPILDMRDDDERDVAAARYGDPATWTDNPIARLLQQLELALENEGDDAAREVDEYIDALADHAAAGCAFVGFIGCVDVDVNACVDTGDGVEAVEDEEGEFWTVYLRRADGRAEARWDLFTRESAERLAAVVSKLVDALLS